MPYTLIQLTRLSLGPAVQDGAAKPTQRLVDFLLAELAKGCPHVRRLGSAGVEDGSRKSQDAALERRRPDDLVRVAVLAVAREQLEPTPQRTLRSAHCGPTKGGETDQ